MNTNKDRTFCWRCKKKLRTRRGWRECKHCGNAARRITDGRKRADIYKIKAKAKDRPCADCGKKFPSYLMDFDHVRGEKLFPLGYSTRGWTVEQVIEEIAKCDVVCCMCHRIREHERGNL